MTKPGFRKYLTTKNKVALAGLGILLLIIGLYILLHNYGTQPGINDTIQAIGQFSTAGALILGFHQLRKNKEKEAEIQSQERQAVLFVEAKLQLQEMIELVAAIEVSKSEAAAEGLLSKVTAMLNVATTLAMIHDEMNDGLEKNIISMYWQNMYCNHLIPRLSQLKVENIFNISVSRIDAVAIKAKESMRLSQEPPVPADLHGYLSHYSSVSYLSRLISPRMVGLFRGNSRILEQFRLAFFEAEETNRYSARPEDVPDFTKHAPELAAIYAHVLGLPNIPADNCISDQPIS